MHFDGHSQPAAWAHRRLVHKAQAGLLPRFSPTAVGFGGIDASNSDSDNDNGPKTQAATKSMTALFAQGSSAVATTSNLVATITSSPSVASSSAAKPLNTLPSTSSIDASSNPIITVYSTALASLSWSQTASTLAASASSSVQGSGSSKKSETVSFGLLGALAFCVVISMLIAFILRRQHTRRNLDVFEPGSFSRLDETFSPALYPPMVRTGQYTSFGMQYGATAPFVPRPAPTSTSQLSKPVMQEYPQPYRYQQSITSRENLHPSYIQSQSQFPRIPNSADPWTMMCSQSEFSPIAPSFQSSLISMGVSEPMYGQDQNGDGVADKSSQDSERTPISQPLSRTQLDSGNGNGLGPNRDTAREVIRPSSRLQSATRSVTPMQTAHNAESGSSRKSTIDPFIDPSAPDTPFSSLSSSSFTPNPARASQVESLSISPFSVRAIDFPTPPIAPIQSASRYASFSPVTSRSPSVVPSMSPVFVTAPRSNVRSPSPVFSIGENRLEAREMSQSRMNMRSPSPVFGVETQTQTRRMSKLSATNTVLSSAGTLSGAK
ncbi:hypothetical protein D9758_014256 [Tetrapyrgos nigripes]|uniref:Uncharacterized protein n=1 Tax=Tetrapyrgos nigripes TaxID=182062 RepID=A0A8H5CB66_9AGAR|nr:hypothetical protein D9758_014256 [Tetrapyrgos nigripes]